MGLTGLFGPPNLEKLKADGNVGGLIKALKYMQDYLTQSRAAEILGNLRAVSAIDDLIAALGYSNSVRCAAAEALGKIGDLKAIDPIIATLPVSDQLSSYSVEMGFSVTRALSQMGTPAVAPLIAALNSPMGKVRLEAIAKALGKIGKPAVEDLIAAFYHTNTRAREWIILALGETREMSAVKPLIDGLHYPDTDLSYQARVALKKIGDPAVPMLLDALKDPNQNVRRHAAIALGDIGNSTAVDMLKTALPDSDLEVSEAVEKALQKMGGVKFDEIGVYFGIKELGGEFYRYEAYKILFSHLDPKKLVGCRFFDGDTHLTLTGLENKYCIAIRFLDSIQSEYIEKTLRDCNDAGLLPTDGRFQTSIMGKATDLHPLVFSGAVAADGCLVTRKGSGMGDGWTKSTSWTIVSQ